MSRTGAILAAITAELERRQAMIDAGAGLTSITLVVRMDARAGRPRGVIVRPEWQSGATED